jgi:hypothetical protein
VGAASQRVERGQALQRIPAAHSQAWRLLAGAASRFRSAGRAQPKTTLDATHYGDATMGMLEVSTWLFALAAIGGVIMGVIRLQGERNPPTWLAMGHGMLAAAGLTLLAYAAWMVEVPALANYALVLFVLAAAGGAYMNLRYHWERVLLPRSWVYAHAALAVVAFLMLALAAYT